MPKAARIVAHPRVLNEPTNNVNSAMKPLNPGNPSEARPAITNIVATIGMRAARPRSAGISRVCARSYIDPTTRNKRAVMVPWVNIWIAAPLRLIAFSAAIPNIT